MPCEVNMRVSTVSMRHFTLFATDEDPNEKQTCCIFGLSGPFLAGEI